MQIILLYAWCDEANVSTNVYSGHLLYPFFLILLRMRGEENLRRFGRRMDFFLFPFVDAAISLSSGLRRLRRRSFPVKICVCLLYIGASLSNFRFNFMHPDAVSSRNLSQSTSRDLNISYVYGYFLSMNFSAF